MSCFAFILDDITLIAVFDNLEMCVCELVRMWTIWIWVGWVDTAGA